MTQEEMKELTTAHKFKVKSWLTVFKPYMELIVSTSRIRKV